MTNVGLDLDQVLTETAFIQVTNLSTMSMLVSRGRLGQKTALAYLCRAAHKIYDYAHHPSLRSNECVCQQSSIQLKLYLTK